MPMVAVHPHTYGEQDIFLPLDLIRPGSSPYVWGTAVNAAAAQATRRFIPIRMGNSPELAPALNLSAVHPHTYGEQHGPVS